MNDLVQHSELLQTGAVPIGSVEFVRRAMPTAGIQEPPIVRDLVDSVGIQHPYAADFGMDDRGQTILIEVNDFWSLGLYKGPQSITEKAYLNLLFTSWKTLNLQKHDARHHY